MTIIIRTSIYYKDKYKDKYFTILNVETVELVYNVVSLIFRDPLSSPFGYV